MQLKKFLSLMLALIFVFSLVLMATSCDKADGKTTKDPGNTKPVTTKPNGTNPHETEPEETTEGEETTAPKGKAVKVTYAVNNYDALNLDQPADLLYGETQQTIYYGETKTSEVGINFFSIALGYKFVGWSDGVTTSTRSGDSFDKDTTIYAIFEYDAYKLPIVVIETDGRMEIKPNADYINAKISIKNTNPSLAINNLDMQIRRRGNWSMSQDKGSYRVKLSEKKNLLNQGKGPAKNWTLLAYYNDFTMLRGPMTFNFARSLENIPYTTSVSLVEVYLNGRYDGVYLLCEHMQVHEYRVNVDDQIVGTDKGYMVEINNNAEGGSRYNEFLGAGGPYSFEAGSKKYQIKSDIFSQSELDYIKDYFEMAFTAAKSGLREHFEQYVDIPSVVDTYIVEELIKNLDVGWGSFYFFKPKGDKLYFGPIWDVDFAGGNATGDDESKTQTSKYEGLYVGVNVGARQGHPWFYTLMQFKWFREEVQKRWMEIGDKLDTIVPLLDQWDKEYKDSLERNFLRWPVFGKNINRTPDEVQELKTHTANVEYLKNWMANRIEWLDNLFTSEEFVNSGAVTDKLQVSGGSGTKDDPYLISKKEDFISFTNMMKLGNDFAGVYFRQTKGLFFSNSEYNGLGSDYRFAGVYDGGGNMIQATIKGTDNCIFPYVSGVIMNLYTTGTIENTEQAAGIARSLRKGGVIINCASNMEIITPSSNCGGITASTEGGIGPDDKVPVIANCYFAGTLSNTQGGPIVPHSAGRRVISENNYYVIGVATNVADGESAKTLEQIKAEVGALLNSFIENAANLVEGLSSDDLCRWEEGVQKLPSMNPKQQ